MSGVPLKTFHRGEVFRALEKIAAKKKTTVRALVEGLVESALSPEPHSRTITSKGRPVAYQDVEAWVTAASMGVTNRSIAERWGVTEQLVSRVLVSRGVRRQKPQARAHGGSDDRVAH